MIQKNAMLKTSEAMISALQCQSSPQFRTLNSQLFRIIDDCLRAHAELTFSIPHIWTLALFPARIFEISRPRLKAWLKRSRDWKVDMNGNHERIEMGAKMIIPIPASYILANSLTESHNPMLLTNFFQVIASYNRNKRIKR